VRRRIVHRDPAADVPQHLLTFDPNDWPDGALVDDVDDAWQVGGAALLERRIRELTDPHERRIDRTYYRWSQARTAWAADHGWPHGDQIDMIGDASGQVRAWRAAQAPGDPSTPDGDDVARRIDGDPQIEAWSQARPGQQL
jgi:hypothetical protein